MVDYQITLAYQLGQGRRDATQTFALDEVTCHPVRETGCAETFRCCMLDCLGTSNLDAVSVRAKVRQQQLVRCLPGAGTRFAQQPYEVDTVLLAMAMAALALATQISSIRKAGMKPLLLALILFVWLVVGGALINRWVFGWLS